MVQSLVQQLEHLKGKVMNAQDYSVNSKAKISKIIDNVSATLKERYGRAQGSFGGKMGMMLGGTSFGTKSGFAMKFGSMGRSQVHAKVDELKMSVRTHPRLENNMKQWVTGKLQEIKGE